MLIYRLSLILLILFILWRRPLVTVERSKVYTTIQPTPQPEDSWQEIHRKVSEMHAAVCQSQPAE